MSTALPAYYHPTTICCIDDNHSFLRSLRMDMPDTIPCLTFSAPEDALEVINQPPPLTPLADRCFSLDISSSQPVIEFNMGALEQEIQQIARFQRLSVLLVDYAMPTMDGLEFCAMVADKDIKIALLTGVADEKTAVAAFNEGLIDRYIRKSEMTSVQGVLPHIESLQRAYFTQYNARLNANLALDPPRFMTAHALVPVLNRIIKDHGIVEYYLARDPWGYLMLRADGSMIRMVVVSQSEQREQLALAESHGAPRALISELAAGHAMLNAYEHPLDYHGEDTYPWHETLIAAEAVDDWLVGVDEAPPVDIDFDANRTSFNQFLRGHG